MKATTATVSPAVTAPMVGAPGTTVLEPDAAVAAVVVVPDVVTAAVIVVAAALLVVSVVDAPAVLDAGTELPPPPQATATRHSKGADSSLAG